MEKTKLGYEMWKKLMDKGLIVYEPGSADVARQIIEGVLDSWGICIPRMKNKYEVKDVPATWREGAKEALGFDPATDLVLQTIQPKEILVHDKILAEKLRKYLRQRTEAVLATTKITEDGKKFKRIRCTADPVCIDTFDIFDKEPYTVSFTSGAGSFLFQSSLQFLQKESEV